MFRSLTKLLPSSHRGGRLRPWANNKEIAPRHAQGGVEHFGQDVVGNWIVPWLRYWVGSTIQQTQILMPFRGRASKGYSPACGKHRVSAKIVPIHGCNTPTGELEQAAASTCRARSCPRFRFRTFWTAVNYTCRSKKMETKNAVLGYAPPALRQPRFLSVLACIPAGWLPVSWLSSSTHGWQTGWLAAWLASLLVAGCRSAFGLNRM